MATRSISRRPTKAEARRARANLRKSGFREYVPPAKPGEKILRVPADFPCDIDAADVALAEARGVLDVLSTTKAWIPGTRPNAHASIVLTALAAVERARVALFGPSAVSS
jgi:hypothetical protein